MKAAAWSRFAETREHYRREIQKLRRKLPHLQDVQQQLVNSRSPSYTVETPIVYNRALDDARPDSEIRLILVADNPGRREQMAENRRYLVGPSGKIAEKFFRDNPALNIDFRNNVIILNKTPIHTPRTVELRELCRLGGAALETALAESQRIMARLLLEFHQALACPVWICGYSEMKVCAIKTAQTTTTIDDIKTSSISKKGGIFEAYANELKALYSGAGLQDSVFLYRHFSMNQFTIDLKRQAARGEPLNKALARIGAAYREKFLW